MQEVSGQWKPNQNQDAVSMTPAAIQHIKSQIQKRGKGCGVRFHTKVSGCSGYKYVIDIIDAADANDKVFPQAEGLIVAVPMSVYPQLRGTQIDFVRTGLNSQFKYTNPNEAASCGCGESFTINNSQ